MQLAIALVGLLTALVPLAASIHQFRRTTAPVLAGTGSSAPPRPGNTGNRRRAGWLLATAGAIVVVSLVAAFVVLPRLGPKSPVARVESPRASERLDRPQEVAVQLNDPLPGGATIWLAYQNEQGGPFVVQTTRCSPVGDRLDCGPLYVGHDKNDPAEFRIVLVRADASATVQLDARAKDGDPKPGGNFSLDSLPAGASTIGEVRHLTLR